MSNVIEPQFQDEVPTRPAPRVPEKLVAFAARVDRLAEAALVHLRTSPVDAESVAAAASTLVQLQALTAGVLR